MGYDLLAMRPEIAQVRVAYDGYGDQGQVEEITYLDKAGNALDIKDEDLDAAIEKLVCANLPEGWEIDSGSIGTVVIDVAERKAHFDHWWRSEEYGGFDIEGYGDLGK